MPLHPYFQGFGEAGGHAHGSNRHNLRDDFDPRINLCAQGSHKYSSGNRGVSMYDILFFVTLALLSGTFGYFYASKRQPKSSLWTGLRKDYEEVVQQQRKEIKKLIATVNWYKQGAIPAGVKNATDYGDDPTPLVDAIITSLPPNWKAVLLPFRAKMIEEAKNNPEAIQTIIEVVKQKAMSKEKPEEQALQDAV